VLAACLAGGPRALACRGTVARLLGIGRPWFDEAGVEVALPSGASVHAVRSLGATAHFCGRVGDGDRALVGVVPATTAARLVVDLLAVRPVEAVFAVVDDVLDRRWATPASIRRCWREAGRGHRAVLEAALLPWAPGPAPASPQEMALSRVLQLHGLPRPVRQHELRVPGRPPRYLGLAYPCAKVAPEYDAPAPRGRPRGAGGAEHGEELASAGWLRLPADASDLVEPAATAYCDRVRAALAARRA
jgi:hypothetical protein